MQVIASIVAMAGTWYNQPPVATLCNQATNYAFLLLFIVEGAVKIYGLGAEQYFGQTWWHLPTTRCSTSSSSN